MFRCEETTARRRSGHWGIAGRTLFALVLIAAVNIRAGVAGEPELPPTVPLWSGAAPLAQGDAPKDRPRLWLYLPNDPGPHPAIVICPGGGYGTLAMDHEGHQIARWLGGQGLACFILEYRHRGRGYGHPAPLLDVQRAIRLVRHRHKEWRVDPKLVGVIGFSAGGHLVSTVSTHFDSGDPNASDPVDRQSCRPDFAILCYPVISLVESYTHRGSRRNLLGKDPDPRLVEELSNERRVTKETPPTFLWHTQEDKAVPVQNSLAYYSALTKHGVPAELHVFPRGRHGLGLARNVEGARAWPSLCEAWLRATLKRE